MSYLANSNGLGFAETFSNQGSSSYSVGPFDVGNWDWHEWALAAVGVYVVVKSIVGGTKRTAGAISKPLKKRARQRKKVSEARRRLREAEEGIF